MTTTALVRRRPLDEAALILNQLCDQLDGGDDITAALRFAFEDARLALADAVDRRIAFDTWIRGAIETTKEARAEYGAKVALLERIHERFKARTKEVLEQAPDLPYEGRLGKIAVQKNAPALKLSFDTPEVVTRRVVTNEQIAELEIDERYVRTEVIHYLETASIKADVMSGKSLPWARVEVGTHVRFRK